VSGGVVGSLSWPGGEAVEWLSRFGRAGGAGDVRRDGGSGDQSSDEVVLVGSCCCSVMQVGSRVLRCNVKMYVAEVGLCGCRELCRRCVREWQDGILGNRFLNHEKTKLESQRHSGGGSPTPPSPVLPKKHDWP